MNRSTFPQQIDSFTELYDLPANMVAQAKKYQELKMKPTLTSTEQAELNSLTAQLSDFIITPETFNKFADAVVSLETFFTEQVMDFIEAKQLEWASYVSNFRHVGVYSSSTAYEFQNTVTYNGDLYLCLKDTTAGTAPTNTTYWQKISTKGDKGDVGLGLAYKGNYDSSKTYALGDAVRYDGHIYYANTSVLAGEVPTGAKWTLWDQLYFSPTAPTTHNAGTMWIKIDS